jgi:hypothetical protein
MNPYLSGGTNVDGQKNCLQNTTNLSLILMLIQELECPRALNNFIVAKIWPRIYIQWLMPKEKTLTMKKISRHMHYSQNKTSFLQHYYFILIDICPFLDMPYWKHMEPINHIFFSQASHTTV